MSVGLCVFISSCFAVFPPLPISRRESGLILTLYTIAFSGEPYHWPTPGREARLTFQTPCATAEGFYWSASSSTRLFQGPSQLDSLVPPRHGDELQMLGAGLDWSLQYGPDVTFQFQLSYM